MKDYGLISSKTFLENTDALVKKTDMTAAIAEESRKTSERVKSFCFGFFTD